MLELGCEGGEWVEVFGGLNLGIEYVIENSYILKVDIEKFGVLYDY